LPTIQLQANGWLALPAELRDHLNLTTGDRLEIESTQGALVLRLAGHGEKPKLTAAPADAMVPAVKRGPGRPRKVVA
jgi:bifunctional DNA-binding transcriptional regulator/antitoxin component of YhaV-PrlF toxin-antitoxin module